MLHKSDQVHWDGKSQGHSPSDRDPSIHGPCPTRDELADYVQGRAEDDSDERMLWHLGSCRQCSEIAEALLDASDTVVRMVRGMDGEAPGAAFLNVQQRLIDAGPEIIAQKPIPRFLGQYELMEPMGAGASGRVFKARHRHLGRTVVVKVLSPDRICDAASVDRFRREMIAVGRFTHPNIVHASDAAEAEGFHFLVMDYCEGVTLAQALEQAGPLSVADACDVVRQAAEGLQCAYDHGVVHRDIKPSNLLLTTDGVVKILDLGLATFYEGWHSEDGLAEEGLADDVTADLAPAGTPEYMAPEQWSGRDGVDIRADIYGLGCTLFKLLSGKTPYRGERVARGSEMMDAHLHADVPSLRERNCDVSAELDGVARRMIAKDRDHRYPRPKRAARAVEPYCEGSNLALLARRALGRTDEDTARDELAERSTHSLALPAVRRRRFRGWLVAVGICALGAVSLVAAKMAGGVSLGPAWSNESSTEEETEGESAVQGSEATEQNPSESSALPTADTEVVPVEKIRKLHAWGNGRDKFNCRMAGGRKYLELGEFQKVLAGATTVASPKFRIQATMSPPTARDAIGGILFGYREYRESGKPFAVSYHSIRIVNSGERPGVYWFYTDQRLTSDFGVSTQVREHGLPFALLHPTRLNVVVEGSHRITVFVDDQPPIIWDVPESERGSLGPVNGPCGIFCVSQSQVFKFFGFEAQPL